MTLAWLTLLALVLVVVMSCVTRANPGVVAVVLGWLVARFAAPWYGATLGEKAIWAGFPAEMFLTLLGVSLLFAQADANGSLKLVSGAAHRLCRGRPGLVPLVFFAAALLLGSAGPGNIAAAGLMAPVAMAAARQAGVSPLLMAVMVGHGAIASSVSPFTAAGVVANQKLAALSLSGVSWQIYIWNVAANALVAAAGYVMLGGLRLWKPETGGERFQPLDPNDLGSAKATVSGSATGQRAALAPQHAITLAVIALMMLSVITGYAHVGMASFAAAGVLMMFRLADERETFHRVPWSVLVMVCGVSVLTSLLEKTGGTQLFGSLIGSVSTPKTVAAVLAFVAGVVSIYSSTTGVVLPAFLPMVGDVAASQPGSNPLSLALAVLVGGNLVDMSPLSTIGALCLAASPAEYDRSRLFQQLLAWGFAMSLVGAAVSAVCF
jgi:di/tricarboxylate transporter